MISLIMNNSEALMALLVVGILILMILPLPTLLLDLLISFNITFALVTLLMSMYILNPLDLSTFPSLLLVVTLFRLSLNICSTRLILLNGQEGPSAAGNVIMAFGNFVVGGNYVVGAIVFMILVLINFLVITKGAGRIAEVAARFTLDAMPGKQMSIDADLNAGIINEDEARARRQRIAREAEYYGAMDGANKFVRGDAIAGIIITLVNIIGGLIIGVFQNDMGFADAARTYTLLTVGDGLVTQIPALVVATAAGIIVTRAGAESGMGGEIASQVFRQPNAILVSAAILLGFSLIPGLPTIPFLALALLAGTLGYLLFEADKADKAAEAEAEKKAAAAEPVEKQEYLPPLDIMALEVGYTLIPLVDMEQDGQLLDRIRSVRRQIARELGLVAPPVHIQDNMQLRPGEYTVMLKGNEIARGELMPGRYLAMYIGKSPQKIPGIPTTEPTYGLPAYWIQEEDRETALSCGYTVVDVPTVLITHLAELIRRHAHELLGREETRKMLDALRRTHPSVVEELIPGLMSEGAVVRVLQSLLREQVPIRDLLSILETLADRASHTKDTGLLTEYARQGLSRTITAQYQNAEGEIPIITLGQSIEQAVSESLQKTDYGSFAALDPRTAQEIMQNVARQVEQSGETGQQPVVVCSAPVRPHFKQLADRFMSQLTVLSYNEIAPTARIRSLGAVEIAYAN